MMQKLWISSLVDAACGGAQAQILFDKDIAVQSLPRAAFAQVVDDGDGLGVEFPFLIQGNVVPEPGHCTLMPAGRLAVLAEARRCRQTKG